MAGAGAGVGGDPTTSAPPAVSRWGADPTSEGEGGDAAGVEGTGSLGGLLESDDSEDDQDEEAFVESGPGVALGVGPVGGGGGSASGAALGLLSAHDLAACPSAAALVVPDDGQYGRVLLPPEIRPQILYGPLPAGGAASAGPVGPPPQPSRYLDLQARMQRALRVTPRPPPPGPVALLPEADHAVQARQRLVCHLGVAVGCCRYSFPPELTGTPVVPDEGHDDPHCKAILAHFQQQLLISRATGSAIVDVHGRQLATPFKPLTLYDLQQLVASYKSSLSHDELRYWTKDSKCRTDSRGINRRLLVVSVRMAQVPRLRRLLGTLAQALALCPTLPCRRVCSRRGPQCWRTSGRPWSRC
jgi:hypothetical protein